MATLDERIAAGQELRRRGSLNEQQLSALAELERRTGQSADAAPLENPAPTYGPGENELDLPNVDQSLVDEIRTAREAGDEDRARRLMARAVGRAEVGEGPENIVDALGGSFEAELRGIGHGAFGVGDFVATAGSLVGQEVGRGVRAAQGTPDDPDTRLGPREMFARVRARREALDEQYQLSSLAGFATGAVTSGGLAVKGVGAIPGVGRTTQAQQGQPIMNFLRNVGGGAAAGGVGGGLEEGSLKGAGIGAGVGAAGGPVFGLAGRVGGGIVRAVGSRLTPNRAGIQALARVTKTDTNELLQRFDDFQEVTGRPPSLVELMDDEAAREIGAIAQSHRTAGQVLNEAEEAARIARPERVSAQVETRTTSSPSAQTARRAQRMDEFMAANEETPVTLTRDDVEMFASREFMEALPPPLRRELQPILGDALEIYSQGGSVNPTIPLRQLDNIRLALKRRGGDGVGDARRYLDLRDEVRRVGEQSVPEYGDALTEFGRRSDTARGVAEGRRAVRSGGEGTREFIDATEQMGTAERAGRRVGTRTALSEAAGESPASARATVEHLADDPGLRQRIAAVLRPSEVDELTRLGRAEQRAARNLETAAPGNRVRTESQDMANTIAESARTLALASGRASGGFQADILTKVFLRARIPPAAAEGLARAVTDPRRTEEVIRALREAGLDERRITELYQDLAVASARAAGEGSAEAVLGGD